MVIKRLAWSGILVLGLSALLSTWAAKRPDAQPATDAAVQIDADDIGGVVTGKSGPEAGVWVIAETNAFQTRFARIVVTDDAGRYVVPDLPAAAR